MCLILCVAISAQGISVRSRFQKGDFKLVFNGQTADILVSSEDAKVVQIAAGDLASDVERVTGKKPSVINDPTLTSANTVIIGTLGKSPLIDRLSKGGKIDAAQIRGKWESFLIATVKNPLPNIETALVLVGSDRRGTAFGVYEMSQMIGVSPWYWWADVTPDHKDNLIISNGTTQRGKPSVKYRGIFLNDEDWGLQPWAAKTFEPETGDIGPKTYAKIFELLLRLKANTLWPAMHEVTRPFNGNPANRQVADDYAIVMGSSHAEPMLRNNVGEWKANKNDYNFVSNPSGVTTYWEERARVNGLYENIYTIGMRGIHDSPILGTRSQAERIPVLEKIFGVQRGLLTKYVNSDVEKVPQIFCPYKEVLADYRAGLKVPDDVTIVFPDDNFGYIRQFPSVEEQKRKGGFGVYYHISYLGRPISYLWLNSTPPSLIWQEMSKAYENGMRQFWIVNVGDIKPAEIGMEFFLQMAYDADRWTGQRQPDYLREWAKREFGAEHSVEIAEILDQYYRLGFQRKPEHLQWHLPTEPQRASDLTNTEKLNRLDEYSALRKRADALYAKIASKKKDALYELIVYPVRSAALANERYFSSEIAKDYGQKSPAAGIEWAKRSITADSAIAEETKYFNESLAGGKWRHMMSPEMNPGQWPSMRSTPPKISLSDFTTPDTNAKSFRPLAIIDFRRGTQESKDVFREWNGIVSIEAEHFQKNTSARTFAWQVIKGLGKTGDSVSVQPAKATTFAIDSPTLEYQIEVEKGGEFAVNFHLVPTQPLVPGNGLRLAFSIDDGEPQHVVADKDLEVSSRKWAQNILDQTTVGKAAFRLTKGRHVLRIHAVDTGVVLDKIVMSSRELPVSYFGPVETLFRRSK
jgi:hypothetical protein